MVSKLGNALLLAQPFFTFSVFLSVLLEAPPLWLSWTIAIIPLPLRFYITGRLTRRTPFDIPILILTAGMLLGFFLSPDYQLRLTVMHTYLACVLFYYGLVNNSDARPGYWGFLAGFLFLILFFLSALAFAGGPGKHIVFNEWAYELAAPLTRPFSMPVNINVVGGALAVVIPGLVAVALFRQRAWVRWSAGTLAVIFGGILVLSASGGGWIAATAGIFIVLLYHRVKTFWGTSLASVVAVGTTLPIWYNTTWIKAVFPIQSLLDRVERWQATIAALKDYPLAGLGLGGWWSKVSTFGMLGGPHNAYLQLYSDTGALGMIALVLAVIISVKLFRQILYADKDSPIYGITAGITAGIIAGGIHALIDDNMNALIQVGNDYLYYAIPLLWLWAALLVVSCQRLLRNTEKDKRIGFFRRIA